MKLFKFLSIYQCLILLGLYSFGLIVFMNGLLPNDTTSSSSTPNEDVKSLKLNSATKLILVIVDGLRSDLIFNPKFSKYWTNVRSYMQYKSAVCSISLTQHPTVTLPRIKAITTGHAPKFIDVLRNLDAYVLTEDSWIKRLVKNNWKLQFFGDDTWLKLFPDSFKKYDGVSSFYVNDFYEVDSNVTRHIKQLMNQPSEWDGLILHYLGLDHIGHKEGPFGSKITLKLQEMDKVVQSIVTPLVNSKLYQNENWLFILTGDHGMTDQGSHGGSSLLEKSTGLFMLIPETKNYNYSSKTCQLDYRKMESVMQVDLASFIGLATNVGIPDYSLGILSRSWLHNFWKYFYEKIQVVDYLLKHSTYSSDCLNKFSLNYDSPFSEIKNNCLIKSMNNQQTEKLDSLMKQINQWLDCYHHKTIQNVDCNNFNDVLKTNLILTESLNLLRIIQSKALLESQHLNNKKMIFGGLILWLVTVYLIFKVMNYISLPSKFMNQSSNQKNFQSPIPYFINSDLMCSFDPRFVQFICGFITVCLILHSLSSLSSSYAEEEHQLWYYFASSILLLIIILVLLGDVDYQNKILICKILFIILLLDRFFLRKFHRSGDKWKHLPDLAGWLNDNDNVLWLWISQIATWIVFIVLRLVGLVIFHQKGDFVTNLIYWSPLLNGFLIAICQLFYRVTSKMSEYELSIYLARICYGLIIIDFYCQYLSRKIRIKNNSTYLNSTNYTVIWETVLHPTSSLILFIGLIGRISVFLLWMYIQIKEALIAQIIYIIFYRTEIQLNNALKHLLPMCSWFIYWTQGWVSYFQQGNSLSLSTIDIAAAYVGLRSHQPVLAGLLLAFHTFAGPLIWQISYIFHFVLSEKIFVKQFNLIVLGFTILPITLCATFCFLLQSHLFIWSVFTPKMLYSAMFYLVFMPILLLWSVKVS